MPKRLSGINPLSYRGVEALQPPNITESKTIGTVTARPPTTNDYAEFNEGDLWMVTRPATDPVPYELWYLARKTGTALGPQAIWVQLYPQGGAGGGGNLRSDDNLIEVPDATVDHAINVWGGEDYGGDTAYINMYTTQLDANTLQVNLKRSIIQPSTNATATEGMYSLGKVNFMHAFGTENTFLGLNTVNIAAMDVAVAVANSVLGAGSLVNLSEGDHNTAVGQGVLPNTTIGQYNTALGVHSGSALDASDSSTILIGSPGKNTESNAIHIGISGAGLGEQDKAYIAGIWNVVPIPGRDTGFVIIDEQDKLSTFNTEINTVLGTDANGNPVGIKGLVGTVLTGHGILPADPAPEFLPLESAGGTVTISTNPISGALNLEAAGVAGLVTLTSDLGVVLPLLGNINVIGGELINTDNLVANTVTINLDQGAFDEVVAGTGAASIYKQLTSSDGSIVYDFVSDPTKIDIIVAGVPPVGGITFLTADSGAPATPIAGAVNIAGGLNIRTVSAAGVVTVHVTDDVDLAGHLYATTDIKTSTGNLIASAGNLDIPQSNNTGTEGFIRFGTNRTIHQFGDITSKSNIFVGFRSGNITLTAGTAVGNTGLGLATLERLTVSPYNTAGGFDSSSKITSGLGRNTAYGYQALNSLVTGAYNTAIGFQSGISYNSSETSNVLIRNSGVALENNAIKIGTQGVGNGQQDKCYIAGIYSGTAGTTPKMVIIGSNHKLSTQTIPDSGAQTYVTDSGNAVPSPTGQLHIEGGYNISTSGALYTITVNLNDSILLPSSGIIALGVKGATTYGTDRFIHAYGGGLGMTGYNTFIGYQAGRTSGVTVIGLNNTVLGALAYDAYTSGSSNVAIGKNALGAATSSSNNVAVGASAGSGLISYVPNDPTGSNILLGAYAGHTYVTGHHNIVLGDDSSSSIGGAAEIRTMRLGFMQEWAGVPPHKGDTDPVETLTIHGTDNTYMYGVYKNTVAYSALPVYVDHLGKLGTDGGVMFAFRQVTPIAAATGDATIYIFGTQGGLSLDFDNSGSVVLGGAGAPAVFTAPYSGKYAFTAAITMSVPASPPAPRPVAVDPLYIFTDNISYSYSNYMPASTAFIQYVSEIVTTIVYLDAGEHAYWGCAAGIVGQAKNIGIVASQTVTAPAPIGVKSVFGTYFTGYRIS